MKMLVVSLLVYFTATPLSGLGVGLSTVRMPDDPPSPPWEAGGAGLSLWWREELDRAWVLEVDFLAVVPRWSGGGLPYKPVAVLKTQTIGGTIDQTQLSFGAVRLFFPQTRYPLVPLVFTSAHVHRSWNSYPGSVVWGLTAAIGLGGRWQPAESWSLWVRQPVRVRVGSRGESRIGLGRYRATVVYEW